MIQQSQCVSRSLFVALWIGGLGLVLAGCDSNGGTDDGDVGGTTTFNVTVENVGTATPLLKSGAFTPADVINDNNNDPPLEPGEAFQFSFTAGTNELPGTGVAFSFASMFVQSNDVYYAFGPGGVPLFDSNDNPIGMNSPADVTDRVRLYDAGTEVDQEPGTGSNQAPRQSSANTGPDENGSIVRIENTDGDPALEDDGFEYPAVADGVKVTVSSQPDDASGGIEFTVTIENVSDETGTTVNGEPLVLSPGSYAVHFDQMPGGGAEVTYPGHAPGSAASDGIEAIAEDGSPSTHATTLGNATGVTVPLSPGAYAVHSDAVSFFEVGAAADAGIEDIAEDGMPGAKESAVSGADAVSAAGVFNTPDGADSAGPLTPGNRYSFSVEAAPGDRLSLATMYIQSNDLFYALPAEGLPLFDGDQPIGRDVTGSVALYDAGTEGDQEPGVGLDQAPRQSSPDTGPDGEGPISEVTGGADDGFSYPATSSIIRVTVSPQ
jgi:hypothetical protein